VGLIIIDPIVSAITGDANGNSEVRRDLQPIVDLAAKCGVAILGISHFKKGNTDGNLLHRVTGSIAFGALARIVMAVGRIQDQDGNTNRILVRAKSNLGISDGGFEYAFDTTETHPGIKATHITWGEYLEGSPQSLLSAIPEEDWERQSAVDEASEFLKDLLKDRSMKATEIVTEAKNAGIQISALKRAKRFLKVKSKRIDGHWEWCLPSKMSIEVST
jgi:putative DNA primase/helicase